MKYFSLFLPALTMMVTTGVLLSACSSTQPIIEDTSEADSLRAQIASLQGTLSFYESIETGSYYRDIRVRDMRIDELEYLLGICGEGGIVLGTELVDDLFIPASADLLESGLALIDSVIVKASSLPEESIIKVAAYSDNTVPGASLKDRYPSNWELSAARAASIARYIVAKHEIPADRIEVVSYGDSRPVFDNNTARGRKLNRRIEFTLAVNTEAVDK